MKQYSFLEEGLEYPYTYDPSTARMRASKMVGGVGTAVGSTAKGTLRGVGIGGLAGGLAGALTGKTAGQRILRGTVGAALGMVGGGAVGGTIGAAHGVTKGGDEIVNAASQTKRQVIDNDNLEQEKILKSRFAKPWEKRQAQARLQRNNMIDANLRNYRDAIAQTPDAADRAEVRRAYRAHGRWINDRHGANMQYT